MKEHSLSIINDYDFVSDSLNSFAFTELRKGTKEFRKIISCKQNGQELEMWFISCY